MSQAIFGPYMECSLNLVVDLVNTEDDQNDRLQTVEDLVGFLREHQMSGLSTCTRADLDQVLEIRAKLRRVFETDDQLEAAEILNEMLASSEAQPILTNHDGQEWHLHYTPLGGPPATRVAAETAMALAVVIAEEGFERLQRCDSDTCDDVFIDASRNRSRRYCSSSICGNRASVRAHRERQRAASGNP